MIDKKGVLNFLKLNEKTKIKGTTGLEQIKYLFKKANRTYQKGFKVEGLVDSLDINLICSKLCKDLSQLCNELNIPCSNKTINKEQIKN